LKLSLPMPSVFPDWDRGVLHLSRADEIMAGLIAEHRGETLQPRGDLFLTLLRSIVGQQISVKAADTVWGRLIEKSGGCTPGRISCLSLEQIRSAGLTRMKSEYVLGIAENPEPLLEARWEEFDDEQVIELLTSYRGVGRWTAEMVMIFGLCRPDVMSTGDLGLRKAVARRYLQSKDISEEVMLEIAGIWRPWRSVASWYLWRSLDPIAVEY